MIRDTGLQISNLIYCRNLLGRDESEAGHHRREVERRVRAAADLRIAFEHCPIMGNWLISPPRCELAFDRLDNEYAGPWFDPSHLV